MNYFVVNDKLPSLNEYVYACRTNHRVGAAMKRNAQALVKKYIREAVDNGTLHAVTDRVSVNFYFVDGNARRDIDNVAAFGHKVILDALVDEGILPDDNREWISGFKDEFGVEKGTYRIYVELV